MKSKSFFFTVLILLSLFSSPLSSLIELPNAVAVSQTTTRGYDYQIINLGNGSHTYTGGLPPYIKNANGDYVPFVLTTTPTQTKVETNTGSFIFNNATCTLTFYDNGNITNNQQPLISDSYKVKALLNGTSNWLDVSSVNNRVCNTSIVIVGDTIQVIGSKFNANAGQFIINYTKAPGSKLKTTLSATNLNSAWTNYHLGATQTIGVPKIINFGKQTYDLSQFNNTVLSRSWINSHAVQLMKLTNKLNFDLDVGWKYVNQITIHYINNQASLDIDYTYNTPIISPGQTITVDPTYGYTGASSYRTTEAYSYPASACPSSDDGRTTFSAVITSGINGQNWITGGSGDCYTGIVEWDLSAVTSISSVSSATLKYQMTSIIGSGFGCDWTNEPKTVATLAATTRPSQNFYLYGGNGTTAFINNDPQCSAGAATYTRAFGSNFTSYLIAAAGGKLDLAQRVHTWPTATTTRHLAQYDPGNIQLTFTYSTSSVPKPTLTHVNTINSTALQIDWTSVPFATWYQVNYTSPASGTFTQLVNQSTTSYTKNGLTPGTQYAIKVQAGNSTGPSGFTPYKSNYTTNIAPTSPVISNILANQSRVSVTNPTGNFSGYKIYQVQGSGTNYTLAGTSSNTTNHFDITGLVGNTKHTAKLQTRYAVGTNSSGLSSNSTTVTWYTLPNAPILNSVTQSTSLLVHLIWTPRSDNGTVNGYKIEQSNNGGASWTTKIANTGNTTTTANISESSAGTYVFRISTIKYGGTSVPSNTISRSIWQYFTVNAYKSDGITTVYGNAIQQNSTSSNNKFPLVSGTAVLPGISQLNNVTIMNTLINFLVGWKYNVNATSTHILNITTNDFVVDCPYSGTGPDVETFTNGTNGNRVVMTTPTCYSNNTMKWKTDFIWNGNDLHNYNTTVYVKVINATYLNNATLKWNQTKIATALSSPYIVSALVNVVHGATKTFYWSMNLTLAPGYQPANFTIGYISASQVNHVTAPIKITTTQVNSTLTTVAVTYPTGYKMVYNAAFNNEQTSHTYTGVPAVADSPSLGLSTSTFTFMNPANDVITFTATDSISNNTANTVLQPPMSSIPMISQIQAFKSGAYGTTGQFGPIDLVTLIVIIISFIGMNRVNETIGVMMSVIIVFVMSFFQLITAPTVMITAIALSLLITVASTKKLPWS